MTFLNVINGLDILIKYYDDLDDYHIGAEHDKILMFETDRPLSEEDVKNMRDLGWRQPETSNDRYDPADGWTIYV